MIPSETPSELSNVRLAANRANAAKSTGPRSAKGKRAASQNSRKHGLTALKIRDATTRELATSLAAELSPYGADLAPSLARGFETLAEISAVRSDFICSVDISTASLVELVRLASKVSSLERYKRGASARNSRLLCEVLLLGHVTNKTNPNAFR
jgi:hypothetical protein